MKKPKLPFGIARGPDVSQTHAALVVVDDHLGKSDVLIETWWSGEGATLRVTEGEKESRIDLSWAQITAFRLAFNAIKAAEKNDKARHIK